MEAVATTVEGGPRPAATRVLLASSRASGGMAQHVMALMGALHGSGYELAVACDLDGMIADRARIQSLPTYGIALHQARHPARAMLAAWHLSSVISGFRAHIVHTHSFHAGLVGAVSAPLSRPARLVATMHGYPPAPRSGDTLGPGARLALRMILGRATRVIAVSEALRRDLLQFRPAASDKTVVIPNGVEVRRQPQLSVAEARAALGVSTEVPLVGMAARLAPQKGVAEFLRAARVIADRSSETRFLLVGDGPLRGEAEALRDELNLGSQVQLLGQVESVRDVLWALDVLVVASLSEGSSISAMEAMALGKPVVGTAVGGVPEVVVEGETGLLVPPGVPEALAEAVCVLLADSERAQAMGERGRQRAAAHFDVELMVERTREVYAGVMREVIEGSGLR